MKFIHSYTKFKIKKKTFFFKVGSALVSNLSHAELLGYRVKEGCSSSVLQATESFYQTQ